MSQLWQWLWQWITVALLVLCLADLSTAQEGKVAGAIIM